MSDGTLQRMNLPAEVGPGVGQGVGLGLGFTGPPLRTLELGLQIGEFTRGLLVLGAPPRLTILHLGRMPLHKSLDGGRRPQPPH